MDPRTRAVLQALIHDELAAAETYAKAAGALGETGGTLLRLKEEHGAAARALSSLWSDGPPPAGSGAWGVWARALESLAALLGERAAFEALHEGERHVIKDYERALDDPNLEPELKSLISSSLLPKTRLRLPALDLLLRPR